MRAAAKTMAMVFLWLFCSSDPARGAAVSRHDHVRTKSGSARQPRTDALTAGMPAVTAIAVAGSNGAAAGVSREATADSGGGGGGTSGYGGSSGDVGLFRDLLVRKPSKMLRQLMFTGVDVVQRGMDVYQSASSKVYDVARATIGRPRVAVSATPATATAPAAAAAATAAGPRAPVAAAATSNENGRKVRSKDDAAGSSSGGRSSNYGRPGRRSVEAASGRPKTNRLADTVIDLLDTGIGGMEQITDLGLLLGNIGTHKIRASLDGQSGNKEILRLLVKYAGSRVGIGAKGSLVQMIDDVGIISTFVANDDEVTTMISTLMERFMNDPEVSKAMVRLAITMLDGNQSTQCVLDKLPLSPTDLRMLFDVFVGSNGQMMMKTVAGLISDLTTGPDTKAFLESALGMVSMFKSGSSTSAELENPEKPKNPTSIFGSLTGLFTGGDIDVDDNNVGNEEMAKTYKKPGSPPSIPKRPPLKRPSKNNKEDPWFNNDDKTILKPVSNKPIPPEEDIWFSGESNRIPVGSNGIKPNTAETLKRPGKINGNSKDSDKDNSVSKKIIKPGGSVPKNINLGDDDGGSIGNGNRIKKQITKPMKKAETDVSDSTDNDLWFNDEKDDKISRITNNNKKAGTITRN